jgi:glucosamine kinase
MSFVLGLDSGGTKTIAVVADQTGQVIAQATGDGLDPTAGGGWEARLAALIAPLPPVIAATLGLPFHGEIAEITARQLSLARSLIGPQATVVNDVAAAFEGAFGGQNGVLILAGTGSMAWARGPNGTHRIGGWGDAFGDEGSAHWIGREALAQVSQHLDGRIQCPAFATDILTALAITGEDLIGWTYRQATPRAAIASVAAYVSALARNGNPDAQTLLTCAAAHLATLGHTAARAVGTTTPNWSYAGGVFNDATVLAAVTAQMASAPIPPILPPIGGAVLLAAKAANWAVTPAFIATLAQSLPIQRKPHP